MEFVYLVWRSSRKRQVEAVSGNYDLRYAFQAQLIVTTFIPVAHGFVVSKDLDVPQGF